MIRKQLCVLISIMAILGVLGAAGSVRGAETSSCRTLVVMSYEEDNPWSWEVKEGIEDVLDGLCEVTYFYMDTKENIKGGPAKAKEAYELFQALQPDGLITVDDNAQSMFVVEQLFANSIDDIPIMFCGVNGEPEDFGYEQASNVSGILERNHLRESIAFASQLVPSIETVGFLAKDSPSGKGIQKQAESEADSYLARSAGFELVKTIAEALEAVEAFKESADLLFIGATNGILDDSGKPLDNKQVTQILTQAYGKPTIGSNQFHVEYGVLCSVVKTGQEQGRTAAEMLLQAMQGTPISDLPVVRNLYGKRVLNAAVLQELGIKPMRRALIGTEIVKTTH